MLAGRPHVPRWDNPSAEDPNLLCFDGLSSGLANAAIVSQLQERAQLLW